MTEFHDAVSDRQSREQVLFQAHVDHHHMRLGVGRCGRSWAAWPRSKWAEQELWRGWNCGQTAAKASLSRHRRSPTPSSSAAAEGLASVHLLS
jgi:hypothetical protein